VLSYVLIGILFLYVYRSADNLSVLLLYGSFVFIFLTVVIYTVLNGASKDEEVNIGFKNLSFVSKKKNETRFVVELVIFFVISIVFFNIGFLEILLYAKDYCIDIIVKVTAVEYIKEVKFLIYQKEALLFEFNKFIEDFSNNIIFLLKKKVTTSSTFMPFFFEGWNTFLNIMRGKKRENWKHSRTQNKGKKSDVFNKLFDMVLRCGGGPGLNSLHNIRSRESSLLRKKMRNNYKYLSYRYADYVTAYGGRLRTVVRDIKGFPFISKYIDWKPYGFNSSSVLKNKKWNKSNYSSRRFLKNFKRLSIKKNPERKKNFFNVKLKSKAFNSSFNIFNKELYYKSSNVAKACYQMDNLYNMEYELDKAPGLVRAYFLDILKFRFLHKGIYDKKDKGRQLHSRYRLLEKLKDLQKPWLKPFETKSKRWKAHIINYENEDKEEWIKKSLKYEEDLREKDRFLKKKEKRKKKLSYIIEGFNNILKVLKFQKEEKRLFDEVVIWEGVKDRVLKAKRPFALLYARDRNLNNIKRSSKFSKFENLFRVRSRRTLLKEYIARDTDAAIIFTTGMNTGWDEKECFPVQLPTKKREAWLRWYRISSYRDVFNWDYLISKFIGYTHEDKWPKDLNMLHNQNFLNLMAYNNDYWLLEKVGGNKNFWEIIIDNNNSPLCLVNTKVEIATWNMKVLKQETERYGIKLKQDIIIKPKKKKNVNGDI
jgi:hypothetical protein